MIRKYAGWVGYHTRDQVAGAYPNGSRVEKILAEPHDGHMNGAWATVLGSLVHRRTGRLIYFVEWDNKPGCAVAVTGEKIRVSYH